MIDLAGKLAGFLALGAEGEQPEGDGQRRDHEYRDDQAVGGSHLSLHLFPVRSRTSWFVDEPDEGDEVVLVVLDEGDEELVVLVVLDGADGVAASVEPAASLETGAASNAATIWNWAMELRVWQVEVVAESELPLELPPSAEDCTPTRVTPSISFSACTKPATASWLRAHPISSSAGPEIDAAQTTRCGAAGPRPAGLRSRSGW